MQFHQHTRSSWPYSEPQCLEAELDQFEGHVQIYNGTPLSSHMPPHTIGLPVSGQGQNHFAPTTPPYGGWPQDRRLQPFPTSRNPGSPGVYNYLAAAPGMSDFPGAAGPLKFEQVDSHSGQGAGSGAVVDDGEDGDEESDVWDDEEEVEVSSDDGSPDFEMTGRQAGGAPRWGAPSVRLLAPSLQALASRPSGPAVTKSRYRGVSFDKKKNKWRVQIKVAHLGKSGVSVGYYDTELAAAQAYDRASIGLYGKDSPNVNTNFPLNDYDGTSVRDLQGKSREEVKLLLKEDRQRAPRRRPSNRQRTSRYIGVGSSNRKNQWQARILVDKKVTHLGYYETEEEAARVYDRVCWNISNEPKLLNFPACHYEHEPRLVWSCPQDLQKQLGVKPMNKSSRFRGVSRKKGKWEAKVMVKRKWAYRELFEKEIDAALAYDKALLRLKGDEARSYLNFKDSASCVPPHQTGPRSSIKKGMAGKASGQHSTNAKQGAATRSAACMAQMLTAPAHATTSPSLPSGGDPGPMTRRSGGLCGGANPPPTSSMPEIPGVSLPLSAGHFGGMSPSRMTMGAPCMLPSPYLSPSAAKGKCGGSPGVPMSRAPSASNLGAIGATQSMDSENENWNDEMHMQQLNGSSFLHVPITRTVSESDMATPTASMTPRASLPCHLDSLPAYSHHCQHTSQHAAYPEAYERVLQGRVMDAPGGKGLKLAAEERHAGHGLYVCTTREVIRSPRCVRHRASDPGGTSSPLQFATRRSAPMAGLSGVVISASMDDHAGQLLSPHSCSPFSLFQYPSLNFNLLRDDSVNGASWLRDIHCSMTPLASPGQHYFARQSSIANAHHQSSSPSARPFSAGSVPGQHLQWNQRCGDGHWAAVSESQLDPVPSSLPPFISHSMPMQDQHSSQGWDDGATMLSLDNSVHIGGEELAVGDRKSSHDSEWDGLVSHG